MRWLAQWFGKSPVSALSASGPAPILGLREQVSRLNDGCRAALTRAGQRCTQSQHSQVEIWHLFMALDELGGAIRGELQRAGFDAPDVLQRARQSLEQLPTSAQGVPCLSMNLVLLIGAATATHTVVTEQQLIGTIFNYPALRHIVEDLIRAPVDSLSRSALETMLQTLAYDYKNVAEGAFQVTIDRDQWKIPIRLDLGPDGTYLWIVACCQVLPAGEGLAAHVGLSLLKENAAIAPAYFALGRQSLNIQQMLGTCRLSPGRLRKELERIEALVRKTASLWSGPRAALNPVAPPSASAALPAEFGLLAPVAQRIVSCAGEEARNHGHTYVGTEHVLLSLVNDLSGPVVKSLTRLGISIDLVKREISKVLPALSPASEGQPPPLTRRAAQAIVYAVAEAQALGVAQAEIEHLVVGLLRDPEAIAAKILNKVGATLLTVRQILQGVDRDPLVAADSQQPPAAKDDMKGFEDTLLQLCRGQVAMVERLLDHEKQRHPDCSKQELLRLAIEHLKRDQ